MNQIINFPTEIHLKIQTYLDRQSAVNYLSVCKNYFELLSGHDLVWQRIFPEISFPNGISAKKYLDLNTLLSKADILDRIERFASKLLLGQTGTFICNFPYIHHGCITLLLKIDLLDKPNKTLIRNRQLPLISPSVTTFFFKKCFTNEGRSEREDCKGLYYSNQKLPISLYARYHHEIHLPRELMICNSIKDIIFKVLEEKAKELNK